MTSRMVRQVGGISNLGEGMASAAVRDEIFIDSLDFAKHARCMSGQLQICHLPRLAGILADSSGFLDWVVHGEMRSDMEGIEGGSVPGCKTRSPFLHIEIHGELCLRCQRCLDVLSFRVVVDSRLLLVKPGAAWSDDDLSDDRFDRIDAMVEQPLLSLLEDEVLLSLPASPRHEVCSAPSYDDGRQACSSFSGLSRLKMKSH